MPENFRPAFSRRRAKVKELEGIRALAGTATQLTKRAPRVHPESEPGMFMRAAQRDQARRSELADVDRRTHFGGGPGLRHYRTDYGSRRGAELDLDDYQRAQARAVQLADDAIVQRRGPTDRQSLRRLAQSATQRAMTQGKLWPTQNRDEQLLKPFRKKHERGEGILAQAKREREELKGRLEGQEKRIKGAPKLEKDFTPESVDEYTKTGNFMSLVRRKPETEYKYVSDAERAYEDIVAKQGYNTFNFYDDEDELTEEGKTYHQKFKYNMEALGMSPDEAAEKAAKESGLASFDTPIGVESLKSKMKDLRKTNKKAFDPHADPEVRERARSKLEVYERRYGNRLKRAEGQDIEREAQEIVESTAHLPRPFDPKQIDPQDVDKYIRAFEASESKDKNARIWGEGSNKDMMKKYGPEGYRVLLQLAEEEAARREA